MLHVASRKLPSGGAKQLGTKEIRARYGQCHGILQLVTKSVRAPRLVKRGTGPHSAR